MKTIINITRCLLLTLLCWAAGSQSHYATAQNQPIARCVQNYTLQLSANGTAVLTPAQIDNGSTGGQLFLSTGTGTLQSSITYTCNQVNTSQTVGLVVRDSAGVQSTCYTVVSIVPASGGCGSTNPPTVQCNGNITVSINPNGVAVVQPSMLGTATAGSTLSILYNGASHNSYTFNCSHVGTQAYAMTLVATNSTGQSSSCVTNVYVTAPNGACNTSNPPTVTCNGAVTVSITPNGVAVVNPSMLGTGSPGTTLSISFNGAVHNAYTFTCNNVRTTPYIMTLVATDSSGRTATCTSNVYVTAPAGACGGTNNYQVSLGALTQPSCNACNGSISVLGVTSANGATAPAPYTYMWSDGTATASHQALCPNQTYQVQVTDANGQVYTTSFTTSCNTTNNPPTVTCHGPLTVSIGPNGVVTVNASQLGAASPGSTLSIRANTASGVNSTSIIFNCAHVTNAAQAVVLVATNSAGQSSTCTSYVYVVDPNNHCNNTPPTVTCRDTLRLHIGANGNVVLHPSMLTNGTTAGTNYMLQAPNGSLHSAYTFACGMLGSYRFGLMAANSTNPASTSAICHTIVIVSDPNNVCGSSGGNYVITDSLRANATCSGGTVTCNGRYIFGSIRNANGVAAPGPYTIVWMDGVTGPVRNDLCPNRPYTFTLYDAHQNAYTHTVTVGCNTGTNACFDPSRIDTNAVCPAVYAPVCGCNNVTYSNSCVAAAAGVLTWTNGPCGGTSPNITITTTGSGCSSTNCTGSAVIVMPVNSANAQFTLTWSDGITQTVNGPTIIRNNMCAGTYTVSIISSTTGVASTHTVVIGTVQGCVWPGDTDDNTAVNNWDLLPIALAHGESGPVRPNASINWVGQTAADWNTANPIAGLPNYKHIDANGDGLIDINDVLAVRQNYGRTYMRSGSLSGEIPFYVQSATVNEGDRISLPIMLGTAVESATNVYGVAFTISYNPEIVTRESISVDFLNSWMGNDLLTFEYDFSNIGKIDVAVARKDRQNISGFGEIAKLNMTIRDDILRNNTRQMDLEILNVRLIRNNNDKVGTNNQVGVVTVNLISSVDQINKDYQVAVFPNPANDVMNIRAENATIESVQVYTMTGQLVENTLNVNANTLSISTDQLPQGIYLLNVKTDKGVHNQKLVVKH